MSVPALSEMSEPAAPPPAAAKADVVRLGVARVSFLQKKVIPPLPGIAARTIPPLVGLALTLIVWELLCSDPGASLPAPSQIWRDAKELILDPWGEPDEFFDDDLE